MYRILIIALRKSETEGIINVDLSTGNKMKYFAQVQR